MNNKEYNIMYNIGRAKYVVNSHDGIKTHRDGNRFFDVAIFKNKKKLNLYIKSLKENGYAER